MSTRALEGLHVLDLSRLLPGPMLTMILADMGADVVKVEAPNIGDYMRTMPPSRGDLSGRFLAVNRNKRSLALDLKAKRGVDAFLRLARRADVVVETFRPGVLDRLGVGYDALADVNPKIVLCSVSGYGQDGPYRERAGHDINYIGLAGVLAMCGADGGKPQLPGAQIADVAGGALWGATAVLGALIARDKSGRGEHLDISMCEGALAFLAHEIGAMQAQDEAPTRGNMALNGGLACYGVYETQDGKFLSVGALEPKFWLGFNQAIGRKGDMAELIASPEQQRAIQADVAHHIRRRTRDEWAVLLADEECCCEPVLEVDELVDHPVHRERGTFFEIDGGEFGPVTQVRMPVGMPEQLRLAPRLGEHSREVLEEYGFAAGEIAQLVG